MTRAVTVLPDPDSPTSARDSPRATSRLTFRMTVRPASSTLMSFSDSRLGCGHFFLLESSRESATKLSDSPVSARTMPGKIVIHQA